VAGETWARDSVLDLIRQFIHEVEEEDDRGRKSGSRHLIFPRYQQLDAVRRLVADARAAGAGRRYLIQHSAGSGKSFTIAWLAHQLATLHDAGDQRVFDSIVVVTDRRVLDRQLQTTMRQFEQTLGVVENIDTTSRQLKEALEAGKTIIVTTLQKFPVIAAQIGALPGQRFAVIVDEAHSSQSGESTKSLKSGLAAGSLEEAEAEEAEAKTPEEELESVILAYAFLAQVLTFADTELEKLYVFAKYLRRLLPADREELPREVQQNIDTESYRIQQTGSGRIALERKGGSLEPVTTKRDPRPQPEEMEALSRIIAELNERFGLNLGPEHRLTLGQMMERLDADPGLDASARINTRENVRLTFDQKVEYAIQDIVDSNFDLYKRITDDAAFGTAVKNFLFDQYLRAHRQAEELIKRGESKTLEFKSTLRWSLKDGRQDDKGVTHAVLKTVAAFLNTEGGDILIGVADDGGVVGIEHDQLETDDKFMRHLVQAVRNGLGDRASPCIDPAVQIVRGRSVCLVSCQRSPEPVFLKWKGMETSPEGDFYVRSGPGSVRLAPTSASEYIRTRFSVGG
jgi:hypothetical protein